MTRGLLIFCSSRPPPEAALDRLIAWRFFSRRFSKMNWTVLGETHGSKKDLERARQALNAASPRTTLVFLEALPVGRFVDGENAWRVAANFASPDPDQNEYLIF